MCRVSIFSSDMTMISYFNIIIIIIIATNATFIRILKILIVFFSDCKFFVKFFFITPLQYLFSSIILLIKYLTRSSPKYSLKGLLNLSSTNTTFISTTSSNSFATCLYKTLLDFAFLYFLALKCFQNLHKL